MNVQVTEGDITLAKVDVLALKYAEEHHGVDNLVHKRLLDAGVPDVDMRPARDSFSLVPARNAVGAYEVMFVATAGLPELGYADLRRLARAMLAYLRLARPNVRSVATTVHGPNFGLDEGEAFESMLAGFTDAVVERSVSPDLESILFVERNSARAEHLVKRLFELLPSGMIGTANATSTTHVQERLRAAGYASPSKPHVFVAMPFAAEFQDVYDYAIQNAVRKSGLLCERVDVQSFTGDILARVQERIRSARFLIADLSTANPNVYLEVGYAWGCGVPCILLIRDTKELKFDVQGQRCISYNRIKDLEEKLEAELSTLLVTPRHGP